MAADPGAQFLEAYFAIQQGDAALRDGNTARAEAKFTRALDALAEIKAGAPDWNAAVVQYRIGYCENHLARLRAQRGDAPRAPVAAPTPAADSDRVRQLTAELAQARAQITQLEEAREQLQGRLDAALAPAAAPAALTPELAELQKRNRELAAELATAQTQLAQSRPPPAAPAESDAAQLQRDLAAVRQELTQTKTELQQTRAQLVGIQTDHAKLRITHDQVLAQLTGANRQLEAARASGAKDGEIIRQLRKENALLRVVADRAAIPTGARAEAAPAAKKWWWPFEQRPTAPAPAPVEKPAAPEPPVTVQKTETSALVAELKAPPPPEPPPAAPAKPANEGRTKVGEAQAALDRGDLDAAEARLKAVLAAEPQNIGALNNLGVVYYRRGDLDQAETTMRRAVQTAPDDSAARSLLGVICFRKGKLDEAFAELTKAVALDPRNAEAHNYLGITLTEKGWAASAEQEMRRAIELNPKYADAHFNLAVIYARQKTPRRDLARHHYDKAISLGAARDPQLEELLAK